MLGLALRLALRLGPAVHRLADAPVGSQNPHWHERLVAWLRERATGVLRPA